MLKVINIPAFSDNYIWLIHKENSPYIAIIDPGDARPVLKVIKENGYIPVAILITHHHSDHIGGIEQLTQQIPVPVYGPSNEGIASITHPVSEGDIITLNQLDCALQVMEVPGHTRGHLAYYSEGALFCGDTLFAGGCGRLFEGTPKQMYDSLEKISSLPNSTLIYCAHEYTLDNLKFAQVVEPESVDLQNRIIDSLSTRKLGLSTVPSSLSLEKATNPFLRCHLANVTRAAENFALKPLQSGAETFSVVRHWKDTLD